MTGFRKPIRIYMFLCLGACCYILFNAFGTNGPTNINEQDDPTIQSPLHLNYPQPQLQNELQPPPSLLSTSAVEEGNVMASPRNKVAYSDEYAGLPPKEIVRVVEYINEGYIMLNKDKFGGLDVSYTIVVQVHERVDYLEILINSLEKVVGINKTLVIFSHDSHVKSIDNLIYNISFCRVLQIHYPFSLQLFPNIFPGTDVNDCPAEMTKQKALKEKCLSVNQSDTYGHFRSKKLSQIKQHWWWKLNYVFGKIMPKYNLAGQVILIEEDHYVMPDMLHMLDEMNEQRGKLCPDCNIMSLGAYKVDSKQYVKNINVMTVTPWYSSLHNMGMVVNMNMWHEISRCSEKFCTFDDYNWDWTLLFMSKSCMTTPMEVLSALAPRIIHIGDCGVHKHDCHTQKSLDLASQLVDISKHLLFGKNLSIGKVTKKSPKPPKPNGGWKDVRDHFLCFHNSVSMPYNKNNSFYGSKYSELNKDPLIFPFMKLKELEQL
uniref:Alpha-1,6-mannosyl-glycoprotein 2-beta-N-acetylglucosaminyltransferase n=1 Tax=Rhabditophanes sp. KR3021 TaxID=114890 RepID=A0AC35U8C6_9BILA